MLIIGIILNVNLHIFFRKNQKCVFVHFPPAQGKMTTSSFMKLSTTVCWSPCLRPSSSVCCASAMRSKPEANSHWTSAIGADYSPSHFSFISFQCRTWMNAGVLCRLEFHVKKEGWGGGGTRMVVFQRGQTETTVIKPAGKTLTVSVGDGLPKTSSTWDGLVDEVSTVAQKLFTELQFLFFSRANEEGNATEWWWWRKKKPATAQRYKNS